MKNFLFFLLIASTLTLKNLHSQGVTICSNNPPDASAVLDLQSTQKGLLLPRLTTVQRNAIQLPSRALVIYNTDNECIEGYFPGGWKALQCDCNSAGASLPRGDPCQKETNLHNLFVNGCGQHTDANQSDVFRRDSQ